MAGSCGGFRRIVAVAAGVCFGLCGWSPQARAQQSAGQTPYTIPVTVQRVVLDVVVHDAKGNPVRGLKKSDFAVFEQQKPQEIRSFEEYDFHPPKNFVAPKVPPLPADTYVNAVRHAESGPLYVIVYDAVHMEFDTEDAEDQGDQVEARKALAAFLADKPAGTRFALFLLGNDLELLQGFTTDQNKLLEVFDEHRPRHIPYKFLMGPNAGRFDTALPYVVMRFLGHYLEGLPGRKNLIWLSSHFPVSVPMFAMQAQVVGNVMNAGGEANFQAQGFDGSAPTTNGESWDFKIMKQAIDALNAAQVSVYPVNVAGLKMAAAQGGIDTVADHIAQATGGHAYYNNNDLKSVMERATEDGENYYELTYSPGLLKEDGSARHIQVKLDRKGCRLEYRQYYFAEDPHAPLTVEDKRAALAVEDQVVAHQAGDSMYAWMEHGAPEAHDLLFRAQFHAGASAMATPAQMASLVEQPAYFVVRKKNKPAKLPKAVPLRDYTIDYLVMDRKAAAAGQVLEFAAAAYNSSGKMMNGISQNAERGGGGHGKPGLFRAEQKLEVPEGAAWLRVAVRDVRTDRIGTMEIPLPLNAEGATNPARAASAAPDTSGAH